MAKNANDLIIFGERTAIKGILFLAFLAAMNASTAYFTGIVILYAGSLASLTDILTLFASYLGLRLSRRRASKVFSYGFYKAETFAALVVAMVTVALSIQLFVRSLDRFFQEPDIKHPVLGFTNVLIMVLISFYLYQMLSKAAAVTNSLSLKNNAADKRNDLFNAFVIFLSIIASYFRIPYVEGAVSTIISLVIFRNGYLNAKDSLFFLLDYWNDDSFIERIRKVVQRNSTIVRSIRKIRLRRAGTFIFGEIYLEINPFAEMQDLRVELDNLQGKILELDPYIKNMNIYTLVPRPGKLKVAIPVENNNGLKSRVARSFGRTKFILLGTVKDKKILKWEVVEFPFKQNEYDKIVNFFEKNKVNVVIDNDMHSLVYCELLAKSYINIFPHFSNVKDAEGMIKILMINN